MRSARLARRNVMDRPLESGLSVLLLAFGVGIISLMLLMQRSLTEDLDRNIKDIDLVLGAKAAPCNPSSPTSTTWMCPPATSPSPRRAR